MAPTNQQFLLASRPHGTVKREDFDFVEGPAPSPGDGELLVEIEYLSLDPAMRGWMNEGRSYVPPVGIGEVMRAGAVGRVVESRNERFAEGDHVTGMLGMQRYAVSDGKGIQKVDPSLAPLPTYLGALGMPGMTAYFGLLEVGKPVEGDTVVVSGAAGAVGGLVGQIAKIKGARVIGIAGGPEKCAQVVEELGFDACIDYKAGDVAAGLREHCPDGINVYFDNVGGEILEACLARLALHARVVICGAISQYNATEPPKLANYMALLVTRSSMTGIIVFDWAARYREGAEQMAQWLAEGKITAREDVVEGFETFPETLQMLFTGQNNGKLVLKV
ncbi:MAG: putative NADP-dependent oxidoreductase [Solirubrobacterales bacterium]|nr:putative NADP-dependent oxidoreductase [Solirubrobacterales bacterium]